MLFISNCSVKMLKHEAEFYGITPLGECVCMYLYVCMYIHTCESLVSDMHVSVCINVVLTCKW